MRTPTQTPPAPASRTAERLPLLPTGGPQDPPILDLGAGTGLLAAAAVHATGRRLWAYEPSAAMRAVLFSRVVDDERLRPLVTVWPQDALHAQLPPKAAAVLLCGVLGHLDEDGQDRLWRRLRPRLDPETPVLVELAGLSAPERVESVELAAARLGRQRYRWSWGAQPDGPRSVRMTSTWTVEDQDGPVRDCVSRHRWRTQSLADVAEIARRHGVELVERLAGGVPLGLFRLHETKR